MSTEKEKAFTSLDIREFEVVRNEKATNFNIFTYANATLTPNIENIFHRKTIHKQSKSPEERKSPEQESKIIKNNRFRTVSK